ncbi:MAG: N-acetylmuramoyl-L-alanine amidase [Streptosporangiales bacterium]|nr:N-acetylmuramoyl-L-alanine amidase [Streptosporangiales bacterium]
MTRLPRNGACCPDRQPAPPPDDADQLLSRRRLLGGAAALGGALVTGAAGLALPGAAAAAVQQPRLHDRAAWRARRPTHAIDVLDRAPDRIVVHHTATANAKDLSVAHAYDLSRTIQGWHMDNNDWWDIGQQLTISRGGHVMEGRSRTLSAIRTGRHVVGAHVADENSHTIGIENEGLYTKRTPTDELLASLVETMAWLCDTYLLDPYQAIVGHRDYNATECPGEVLYDMLPELRDRVAAAMGQRPDPKRTVRRPHRDGPFPPSRGRFDHGPAV